MNVRGYALALFLAGSWVLAAVPVGAQEQDAKEPAGDGEGAEALEDPEDPEAAREAREHFRRGMAHFEEHNYREAIREFHVAAKLVPSADLWFNIARAHEELSELEAAVEHYRRYLRDRVDPPDQERVEQHIEELQRRIQAEREAARKRPTTGTLRIRAEQEGASIEVDEQEVGEAPVSVPLTLSPGSHRLEVSKEGHVPLRAKVTTEAGVTTGAYADLEPATEYRTVRKRRVWTWVIAGLAGGALLTSAGLGIQAVRLNRDDRFDEARDWAAYADYALGAALGLGVVATILYFVEGRSRGSERVP